MDYDQTIEYLYSLQKFGIKFGLSSTENLLNGLGQPQKKLPALHLAGTNGKGSVGATACSILTEAGYKVGFFTSPHLVSFRERFAIGRNMIDRDDVVRLAAKVQAVCSPKEPPTFFEFVTAMAFLYFSEMDVDLAIMETGMGGRLDATNVARTIVGVITNISLEHTDYLGRTLREIASEKAGIIKSGIPMVTGEKRPHVRSVFEETSREKGGRLFTLGRDFRCRARPGGGFNYYGLHKRLPGLKLKLQGGHQVRNAGLALAALELLGDCGFPVGEDQIRKGLEAVHWPGRWEIFPGREGQADLMLDGAHNPAAARTLACSLAALNFRRVHLVLGIMMDKDIAGIMEPLLPLAQTLYLAKPAYFRAADTATLASSVKGFKGRPSQHPDVSTAIEAARAKAGPDDLVLVTGSLFTVGEARAFLTGICKD